MSLSLSFHKSGSVFTNTLKHLILSQQSHQDIEKLKMNWAHETLKTMRTEIVCKGSVSEDKSILFLGNHISYLDIPLLLSCVPKISFVAKEEVSRWPLFGTAAKRVNTVFVKRDNPESRFSTKQNVALAIEKGQRIAVFPSGTTCLSENKPWRNGIFKIVHEMNSYIQPFRIDYSPRRQVAYIDNDTFIFHLLSLSKESLIRAEIEFHEPVKVKDPIQDCLKWQKWCQPAGV
jgi:1-acyl-sn-glycerol-3-phosphate acyltransferase